MGLDVVVVGGGIAGAAAAWALAAEHRVVLVEREAQPGHHATGRSAAVLSETSGTELTCRLAAASRPFFEQPPDGFADHPLLAPRGLVWVGSPGDEAALDDLATLGRAVRPSVQRVDGRGVAALVPVLRPERASVGGVHEPDARAIDVAALLAGYVQGLRRRGGAVRLGAEALRGERAGGRWRVTLPGGTLDADVVVDAAGAWADDVAARCGVEPLGLVALRRTACIAKVDGDVSALPLVMDVAGRFYCEPEPGGLLVSPADETPTGPCDAQPDELDVALGLERLAEATVLAPRHVRRAWAGLRTFTHDRSPVAAWAPGAEGFVWLAGQGGAGIKTAPALAQAVAALVAGRDAPAELVDAALSLDALRPRPAA